MTDSLAGAAAPLWRREPYRVLFPLGLLLSWAGVLHWLLHAAGLLADYRPVFHAIVQIQGFLMSFAVGFLFTAIPRRTGTPPPAAWQMALGTAAPIGTAVAAWFEYWALSQAFWLALAVTLIIFAARRFTHAGARRPPNSFLWIPLALLMGVSGSLLTAAPGLMGTAGAWLHDLGRLLLLQGLFLGLVLGVGGMVIPLITRGQAPPDAGDTAADQAARFGHLAAAALLVLSFWLENSGWPRAGPGLRCIVVLAVLLRGAGIRLLPGVPGWHRRLVWLSAWMIPAGYAVAALWPLQRLAGLHVVFIGGFTLMTLSVALHVTLSHGGRLRLVTGRPWQVPVYGGLILLAMAARALVEFDAARFYLWLGVSAALFLIATLFWSSLTLPHLEDADGELLLPRGFA